MCGVDIQIDFSFYTIISLKKYIKNENICNKVTYHSQLQEKHSERVCGKKKTAYTEKKLIYTVWCIYTCYKPCLPQLIGDNSVFSVLNLAYWYTCFSFTRTVSRNKNLVASETRLKTGHHSRRTVRQNMYPNAHRNNSISTESNITIMLTLIIAWMVTWIYERHDRRRTWRTWRDTVLRSVLIFLRNYGNVSGITEEALLQFFSQKKKKRLQKGVHLGIQ